MRKLNGITINGEYLGNSVVINGMFRAICTISPVMMRDFIDIINKIEFLDEAVKIRNFNCGFDSINIEFENKTINGIASLYFKLFDGEPVLTDCKLKIGNEEYSTIGQDKISLPQTEVQYDDSGEKRQINESNEFSSESESIDVSDDELNEIEQEELSPLEKKKKKLQELLERRRKQKAGSSETAQDNLQSDMQNFYDVDDVEDNFEQNNLYSGPIRNGQNINNDTYSTDMFQEGAGDNSVNRNFRRGGGYNKGEAGDFGSYNDHSQNIDDFYNQNNYVNENNDYQYNNGRQRKHSRPNLNIHDLSEEEFENLSDEDLAALDAQIDVQLKAENQNVNNNRKNDSSPNSEYTLNSVSPYESNSSLNTGMSSTPNPSSNPEYTSNSGSPYEPNPSSNSEYTSKLGSPYESNPSLNRDMSNSSSNLEYPTTSNSFSESNFSANQNTDYSDGQRLDSDFIEKLSKGLTDGLAQGLTQGLSQCIDGLSQGFQGLSQEIQELAQELSQCGGPMFNNQNYNAGSGQSGFNFSENMQPPPNFGGNAFPTGYNYNAPYSMPYGDSNYNVDEMSDIYSDFYSNNFSGNAEGGGQSGPSGNAYSPSSSSSSSSSSRQFEEFEKLRAELEALRARAEEKKDLMTLDEFKAKQNELKIEKEKMIRSKLKIVGSRGHVNASALDGGVFVAGNKIYKWGDPRHLDE